MTIDKEKTLYDSASEVFETMVFMDITPYQAQEGKAEVLPSVLSSISFSGKCTGALTIICSEECAKVVTMNILGIEDEDEMEESDVPDAMGEMANMCMGAVKARLLEEMGELAVSVPSVVSGVNMIPKMRDGGTVVDAHLNVDDQYPMKLNFTYYKVEA